MPFPSTILDRVLKDLLQEEHLPLLDRWFSRWSKEHHLSLDRQREAWRTLSDWFRLAYVNDPAVADSADPWAMLRQLSVKRPVGVHRRDTSANRMAGIPVWLDASWHRRVEISRWSAAEESLILQKQKDPAPVYLWFRARSESRDLIAAWESRGWVKWNHAARAFQWSESVPLADAFSQARGRIEIQDASSQRALESLELKSGHRVWDVCAGAGGKTLKAAEELQGRGVIFATEVNARRLQNLRQRVRAADCQNVRVVPWSGESLPSFGKEQSAQPFDRIILDVPCSASGTWRRDPEARLRLTKNRLLELTTLQARLAELSWTALKPGGRMAYITCSWLPEEDEDIANHIAQLPGARQVSGELWGLPRFDANLVYSAVFEKS